MCSWESTVQPQATSSAPTEASGTLTKSPDVGDYWTETAFREGGKEPVKQSKGRDSGLEEGKPTAQGRLSTTRQKSAISWADDCEEEIFEVKPSSGLEEGKPTAQNTTRPESAKPRADDWEAETFQEDSKAVPRTVPRPSPTYDQTKPNREGMRTQHPPRRDLGYEQSRMAQEPQYPRMPAYPTQREQWQAQSFQAARQLRPQPMPAYRAVPAYDDWSAGAFQDTRQMPRRPMNQDFPTQDWYRADMRPSQPSRQERTVDVWGVPVFKSKEESRVPRHWGRTDYAPTGNYRPQGDYRPREDQSYPMNYPTAPRGNGPSQPPRSDLRSDPSNDFIKNQHSDTDFYVEEIPINPELLAQDSHFRSDRPWDSFGFPPPLLTAIQQTGREFPSKIQEMGFDLLMKGQYEHVVVQAPTGSGKTLAFVLPTLALIDPKCLQPQIVVIAPTQELLNQLTAEYAKYAKTLGMTVAYIRRDYEPHPILLMTPRECSFLLQSRPIEFTHLKFAILDEADHLLDKDDQMEFAMNAETIVKQVPSTCHVLCFSATYSDAVRTELDELLGEFSEIMVKKEDLVLENIKMYYVKRGLRETKLDLLERVLERKVPGVTLIFVNTVRFAQVLSGILTRRGCRCALLVGRNITVNERVLTVQDFKRGFYEVVVSTNLLARGIDNTHITRVINFDIPNHWTSRLVDSETYLHRIGRAGRFARAGEAITMVASEAELKMVEEVMQHYGCVIEQLPMEPTVRGDR